MNQFATELYAQELRIRYVSGRRNQTFFSFNYFRKPCNHPNSYAAREILVRELRLRLLPISHNWHGVVDFSGLPATRSAKNSQCISFPALTFRLPIGYSGRGFCGIVNDCKESFAISRSSYVQLHWSVGGSEHTFASLCVLNSIRCFQALLTCQQIPDLRT